MQSQKIGLGGAEDDKNDGRIQTDRQAAMRMGTIQYIVRMEIKDVTLVATLYP